MQFTGRKSCVLTISRVSFVTVLSDGHSGKKTKFCLTYRLVCYITFMENLTAEISSSFFKNTAQFRAALFYP